MADELPFMPLYVRDWLTGAATKAMTTAQLGAFVNLLCHAWTNNPPCSLPDDDVKLARWSGMDRQWRKDGQFVKEQFTPSEDGHLRNPKQFSVYNDMIERRSRKQFGADKTNAKRNADRIAKGNAKPIASRAGGASRIATATGTKGSLGEESKAEPKTLTPQQAGVRSVLAALSESACNFVEPTPQRIVAWVRDFGEEFSVSVIRDVGAGLDGKSASYLHAILRDRFAAGWRPRKAAIYTERRTATPDGFIPTEYPVTGSDIRDLEWELRQDEWTRDVPREVVAAYVEMIRADYVDRLHEAPTLTQYASEVTK